MTILMLIPNMMTAIMGSIHQNMILSRRKTRTKNCRKKRRRILIITTVKWTTERTKSEDWKKSISLVWRAKNDGPRKRKRGKRRQRTQRTYLYVHGNESWLRRTPWKPQPLLRYRRHQRWKKLELRSPFAPIFPSTFLPPCPRNASDTFTRPSWSSPR